MKHKSTLLGSGIAFLIATSCCWLPALIIALGGGGAILGITNELGKLSGLFFVIGIAMLGIGIYPFIKRRNKSSSDDPILQSTITCPDCGFSKEETMPTDACQFFYECEHCKKLLKPKENDCCVYCSFGTVACPPIQLNQECC